FKSTGDGVVAQFPTVADAFAWAKSIQLSTCAADITQPPIAFRIAIDYGEMQTTDDDVYGVVVNAAARLQEIAPPGGIVLTKAAIGGVPDPLALRDLGTISLRNFEGPVRAFVWDPPRPVRVPRRPPISGIPSIAVMPLENLGGDQGDEYFGACI